MRGDSLPHVIPLIGPVGLFSCLSLDAPGTCSVTRAFIAVASGGTRWFHLSSIVDSNTAFTS